jgi:hypothetical protein
MMRRKLCRNGSLIYRPVQRQARVRVTSLRLSSGIRSISKANGSIPAAAGTRATVKVNVAASAVRQFPLERCWLSVVNIDRPGNGQDLPLPINFAHLPVFDA